MHHRQVDERLSKRSKKNDDKSAVVMLKKNDWHENVGQLVVNRDRSHDRPGRPDINRDTCHELKQGPVVAPSRMLVLQDQEWLSVWGKVLICTSSG